MMKKNVLFRHLKAVVYTKDERPILQCIHFDSDGSIVVTDSHVLLRLADAHHLKEDFNLNAFYMTEDEGQYPDTSRLIPTESEATITLTPIDVEGLQRLLKGQGDFIAIEPAEGNDHAQLIGEGLQFPFGSWDGKAVGKTSLNPKYLLEALNFFNDYVGEKGVVRLSLTSPLRPMVLTADKATYLITPVRTF